ncbi:ArdC family protein [Methylorubrum sp. SB2]|uniref:ArdC family protein n=1 Tax=Methylorubrum subtropicum TaxID=3138812 RepID=UPI00313CDCEC
MSKSESKNLSEAWQEEITARIIRDLEEGVPAWVKPWTADRSCAAIRLPTNAVSSRPYSGINILALWAATMERGFRTHAWLTYQQANEIGARIKKGEKSEKVVFVKFLEPKEESEGNKGRKIPMLRVFWVFNLDQCENVPPTYLKPPEMLPPSEYKLAMTRYVSDIGVTAINFGCQSARYIPSLDQIEVPDLKRFSSDEAFSGTLAHEAVHATGHKDRLARKYGERFGDEAYAYEELVAELGSAFLCAQLGIPPTTRTQASYIASWVKVLKGDHRAITSAASYASQALTFLNAQVEQARAGKMAAE